MSLAFDICLGSLPLSMQGIEVLLQAVLGGLPCIDRAAKEFPFINCHRRSAPPVALCASQKSEAHSTLCNDARYGRQALVGLAVPEEAVLRDRYVVRCPVQFPHQDG